MPRFLIFISLVLIQPLFSQNIYNDVKDSIISLEHGIFLDSADCLEPSLIEKIEDRAERDLLDMIFPIQTGTGFIIDSNGYALSNRHVIRFEDLNNTKQHIGRDIAESFIDEFGYDFSNDEKKAVIKDFSKMFSKGEYKLKAVVSDEIFNVEVLEIAPEEKEDLALIRLQSDEQFKSILFADVSMINDSLIGETVYSFGFPLETTINAIFGEKVVSMNKGNVSAFRQDELGIQHNAAISRGNSGGPLVNEEQKVIGINTALIEDGNSLFYSIGIDRAAEFLNDTGYSDILKWNARNGKAGSKSEVNLNTNRLGELESSSDLLILGEKGSEIFIDNFSVGRSPMYYTLKKPLTDIRIVGSEGEFQAKIRLLGSLKGTTELIPVISEKTISLNISDESEKKVSVYADGRFMGTTPISLDLPKDLYSLSFKSKDTVYEDYDLNLETNQEIVLKGKPGNFVRISDFSTIFSEKNTSQMDLILGRADTHSKSAFIFKSGSTVIHNPVQEYHLLAEGHWSLEIIGPYDWDGVTVDFEVKGDTVVDLLMAGGGGALTIRNFDPGMDVYIDGIQLKNPQETIVNLPLGLQDVFIWQKGRQPYEIDITIRNDDSAFITYESGAAHANYAWFWGSTCLIAGGAGLALGLVDTDPYALDRSDNYEEYLGVKEQISMVSSGLIISGALMIIPALVEWAAQGKDNKRYRDMKGASR